MSKRSHAIVVDARMIDHETFFLSKSDSISAIRFLTNRHTSRRNAVRAADGSVFSSFRTDIRTSMWHPRNCECNATVCACTRHKVESYANMLKAYPERSRSFNALLNRVLRAPTDRFTCAAPRRTAFLVSIIFVLFHHCVSLLRCRFHFSFHDLRPVHEISLLQRGSLVMKEQRILRSMRANAKVLKKIWMKYSWGLLPLFIAFAWEVIR